MDEYRNKVEALLYTTGREMSVDEIASMVGLGSPGMVKELLVALKDEYATRKSALIILQREGKWKLAIKKSYLAVTESLLHDAEMDAPMQKTLAVIAYKQPATQSEVIKVRGNKAYEHIKALKENDFVMAEKHGRTRLLKVSQKFYDYFDVVADTIKEKLHVEPVENGEANLDVTQQTEEE
ncbi:SMC-Scp complex subunit ScpB [archaeon]|nr:SMC-Scp complex subunit ScpB [archaeon]|tara:strand:- start:212 stop:754 length:543 start_codon:yes stop_codon:yes gene_type:complete